MVKIDTKFLTGNRQRLLTFLLLGEKSPSLGQKHLEGVCPKTNEPFLPKVYQSLKEKLDGASPKS